MARMSNSLCIILPLPPKQLSPNWRGHWAVKSKVTKSYRATACAMARVVMGRGKWYWKAATVQPWFYFKTNRRRDGDNLLASLKAGMDGLADAGLVENDSQFTYLPVVKAKDAKNPRVELVIGPTVQLPPDWGKVNGVAF